MTDNSHFCVKCSGAKAHRTPKQDITRKAANKLAQYLATGGGNDCRLRHKMGCRGDV